MSHEEPLTTSGEPQEVTVGTFSPRFDNTYPGGGVVVAGASLAGRTGILPNPNATITVAGIPANATVQRALLYWAISNGSDTTATFAGQPVTGQQVAVGGQTCWGGTNRTFRADVTGRVTGNGNYVVTGLPSALLTLGPDTDGVALMVVYQVASQPARRILIRDGAITTAVRDDVATDTFPGLAAQPGMARLHMIVGDGQSSPDGQFTFAGQNLGTNQWQGGEGPLWDTQSYNINFTAPQASAAWRFTQDADCILFVASALEYAAPNTSGCGNGTVGTGETCDDGNTTSGDGCSTTCQTEPGWNCTGVPSVCTTQCGDGVPAGTEQCDDGNTTDGDGCSSTCVEEDGWECNGIPSQCSRCGDGDVGPTEGCDDGNNASGDGCSPTCTVEPGWDCTGSPSVCDQCGNGQVAGNEACDDGNTTDGDGCSGSCREEPGWNCLGSPSVCQMTCGDGMLQAGEECDDGNIADGDGCSPSCREEPGWNCQGEPSTCEMTCGDGEIQPGEDCDDGNAMGGDGCSPTCRVEDGWDCTGQPSTCSLPSCGNGRLDDGETCDDGNTANGDGCSASCAIEQGYICTGGTSDCDPLVVAGGGCSTGGGAGSFALFAVAGLALVLRRRRRAARAAGLVGLGLVVASAPRQAAAQATDIPAQRYVSAMDRDGLLSVESPTTSGHLTLDLGLWLGYADDPLTVRAGADRDRVGSLVHRRIDGALIGSIGITEYLELGVAVPLILSQKAELGAGIAGTDLDSFGLGDLTVMPKVALLRGTFQLAVAAHLTLPTSSSDDFFGNDGVSVSPMVLLGVRKGPFRAALDLGYRYRSTQELFGLEAGDELFGDLGVGLRVARPVELMATFSLATSRESPFDDFNNNFSEVRGGVGIDVSDKVRVYAAGGAGLSEGWGTPDWRALAGVWISPNRTSKKLAAADRDGDGIPDEADRCPDAPETRNGFEDEDGCPDHAPDGTPDPAPVVDSDGDGIPDPSDKCPTEPEDKDGFQDDDGCPDLDNDGDGVVDASDRCRDEAGPVENGGCPDSDRDGDGVVDRLDNCPDEKGTAKNHGCKTKQLVVFDGSKIALLDVVYFKLNKAIIEQRSNRLLNNVAAVLKAHPEVTKVTVEGHTDAQGDDAYNLDLSQRRAQAVVDFLVKVGIPADKLVPIGYGETRPIGDNKTKAGRAANRRVEFKLDGISAVQSQPLGPSADPIETSSRR
ncbi:MAG: DUF4215 domain-containing protein [Kofleriaceae bacterium]